MEPILLCAADRHELTGDTASSASSALASNHSSGAWTVIRYRVPDNGYGRVCGCYNAIGPSISTWICPPYGRLARCMVRFRLKSDLRECSERRRQTKIDP